MKLGISHSQYRTLALAFPEAEELPHFEKTSFRVKKKIFGTLNIKENRACIKLNAIDQSVYVSAAPNIIYPVPNAWGKQGWTNVLLGEIDPEIFAEALKTAYCTVAPKKLADLILL